MAQVSGFKTAGNYDSPTNPPADPNRPSNWPSSGHSASYNVSKLSQFVRRARINLFSANGVVHIFQIFLMTNFDKERRVYDPNMQNVYDNVFINS